MIPICLGLPIDQALYPWVLFEIKTRCRRIISKNKEEERHKTQRAAVFKYTYVI